MLSPQKGLNPNNSLCYAVDCTLSITILGYCITPIQDASIAIMANKLTRKISYKLRLYKDV